MQHEEQIQHHPQSSQPVSQPQNSSIDPPSQNPKKSEEDYKKSIMSLEHQNEKYRSQLYELGSTVTKILQQTKVTPISKTTSLSPTQQHNLIKHQLHNVNQLIQIYQKQLNTLESKKKQQKIDIINTTQLQLQSKQHTLVSLKKQLKQMTHKNKIIQCKIIQQQKKNKYQYLDQQASQLKKIITQNNNLKDKLNQIKSSQQKKSQLSSSKLLSDKPTNHQNNQSKLPKIVSKKSLKQPQKPTSLQHLQHQKNVYIKWLNQNKTKNPSKIDQQLQQLQKTHVTLLDKIKNMENYIHQIQSTNQKSKDKNTKYNSQTHIIQQNNSDETHNKPQIGTMTSPNPQKTRRQLFGQFTHTRFSDSRLTTQQTRLFKITYNTSGYYKFHYYSLSNNSLTFTTILPFKEQNIVGNHKQEVFMVQYPDFVKNIKIKINPQKKWITQIVVDSQLGVHGKLGNHLSNQDPHNQNHHKQDQHYHTLTINNNQSITTIFGSYILKTNEKQKITQLYLQGLGVQLIANNVQEMI